MIPSGGSRIFPRGAPTPKSAIIFQFFAENCMKMKEFGPPGGARPWRPPWIRQWIYITNLNLCMRAELVLGATGRFSREIQSGYQVVSRLHSTILHINSIWLNILIKSYYQMLKRTMIWQI